MRSIILLILIPFCLNAQTPQPTCHFPQQIINSHLQQAWQHYSNNPSLPTVKTNSTTSVTGVYQFLQSYKPGYFKLPKNPNYSGLRSNNDTLFVGTTNNDTVIITGTWQNNGPILVANNGVLIFENANATILGNIYVLGVGQLIATNSTLYIPQQYFYQRSVVTAQAGSVLLKDCTMNFGGVSHNFLLIDSSSITVQNVHFTDWTTTGTIGHPKFSIDTCNVIGEIILSDSSTVNVQNTDTVLLWHHIPKGDGFSWTFPDGVNLSHYSLTPTSRGVSGMKYTVEADNCKLAWWALMPEDGSDVKISNSSLRAIGAWFTGTDSATVTGLVDNSTYQSSGNLFTDRTLLLDTTSVTTWSLYPMDKTQTTIKSCIAGEIGSENTAKTTCISTFVDGTGGYFWAADTSVEIGELCAYTSDVRSEGNSIVLVGYSTISDGLASGIDNSILFLVQTSALLQPIAYDASDVWMAEITPPANAFVNDSVSIPGSAYILRGPTSQLMSFDHYKMYYQPNGGSVWFPVTGNDTVSVNQNTIAKWNTAGLAPGNYSLMLSLFDNYGDSIFADASITLFPAVLNGIQKVSTNNTATVSPNPASNQLIICSNQLSVKEVRIINAFGQLMLDCPENPDGQPSPSENLLVDVSELTPGIYFYQLTTKDSQIITGKFVKE